MSGAQITRLETGERRLSVDWMHLLAHALGVPAADLLSTRPPLPATDEIGPADPVYAAVAAAIKQRGLRLYQVLTDSVLDAGIKAGTEIAVDETPEGIVGAKDGDVVVVDASDAPDGDTVRLLRQFIKPRTLITNRPGLTDVMTLDDTDLRIRISGVVIRE